MKHNIHIGYEPEKGIIIENLDCPYEKTIDAIEIILQLHYVEGDMTPKEALDEICHLVLPESHHSCSESADTVEK